MPRSTATLPLESVVSPVPVLMNEMVLPSTVKLSLVVMPPAGRPETLVLPPLSLVAPVIGAGVVWLSLMTVPGVAALLL